VSAGHSYIVIPHLRVEHANALQTWWIIGTPSPMTVHGFVRALGLKLDVAFDAFAIVHHNVQWLASEVSGAEYGRKSVGGRDDKNWDALFWNRRVVPHQVQGASYINKNDHIAGGFSKGLQPTARCHVEMSIVVRAPMDSVVDPQDIIKALWSGFLGGGSIAEHGDPAMTTSLGEAKQLLTSGHFIVDRADLTQKKMRVAQHAGGADALEVILECLVAQPRLNHDAGAEDGANDGANDEERPPSPARPPEAWLSANVIGYIALEDPRQRIGVRGDLPHAYAEALVGLIEYRSVRNSPSIPFWSYTAKPECRTYLVRAQAPMVVSSKPHSTATPFSI
jgi:CRISPR-associated protein Csy2